jgi:hypothetical protein
MLRENNIVIDPNKSAEFCRLIKTSGKNKRFWDENKRVATTEIDKHELDSLIESDES